MKTFLKPIFSVLFLSIFLFSCEKGEFLNSEADILDVLLPVEMKVGKAIITNDKVRIPKLVISVEDSDLLDNQLKSLALQFVLSPGASVSDAGVFRDFTRPQIYTVTSEDGKWKKEYEVSFFSRSEKKEFNFSHYSVFETSSKKKYHEFYEMDEDTGEKQYIWASGNGGFAQTAAVSDPPESYPTFATPNGKSGTGAELVTRSTGGLGALVKMPIAAGNLFLGNFNASTAMTKPLEATQFGIQTTSAKPLALHLWGKYKAGPEYKDKNGNVLAETDFPDIYAVLYEPQTDDKGNPVKLNGTNIQTAANIVSIALLSKEQANQIRVNDIDRDEYVYIEIPFESRRTFDPEKQAAGKYYFTIVFSSGAKGNLFEGAVGSTLYVDEVELITEK